tara:strand:- start:1577 stop:3088 length:1512 start_codon:yes stop_codon:yes gene_type:complete
MPFLELINDINDAWSKISYGVTPEGSLQAGDSPREFKIDKLQLTIVDEKGGDDETFDIRDLVLQFSYHESIESAFLRCDISILDSVDFNRLLKGGEKVRIKMTTATAFNKEPLDTTMVVYKIGSISKTERGQLYILHCISPEMYHDEGNKVFKAFGPGEGTLQHDCIPKLICEKWLKCKGGKKLRTDNFENHSQYTFVACSWKPSDTIAFLSDKVTRLSESKADKKQSGFLFWENRNGFNFRSIDSLAKGEGEQNGIYTYNYQQQAQQGVNPMYAIESVTYPDKANHLANMRMGTYKTAAIGISLPSQKDSFAPPSGSKEEAENEEATNVTADSGTGMGTAPGGTINETRILTYKQVFAKADTVEKFPPFAVPDFFDLEKAQPTRMKIRALPGMKNQTSVGNPNNGTNPDVDSMAVAQYAAARYNLLKAIKLNIVVPGNTALAAGGMVKVIIPASVEDGENVKQDLQFSGKYIVAALTHVYRRTGITTKLFLIRDSKPKGTEK